MDAGLGQLHPVYMAKKVVPRFREAKYRRYFFREWRIAKGRTLEQAADAVGITHASLSRIERGLQPYTQAVHEALAEYYGTHPASLLWRNPADEEAIWSIWDNAEPGVRRQIEAVARALTRTGTVLAFCLISLWASDSQAQPRHRDHVVVPASPYAGEVKPEVPGVSGSTSIIYGISPQNAAIERWREHIRRLAIEQENREERAARVIGAYEEDLRTACDNLRRIVQFASDIPAVCK